MKNILDAINRPAEAFRKQRKAVAWLLVAITILIVTLFDPLFNRLIKVEYHIDILYILQTTMLGGISYLSVSIVLWVVCKCFGSKTALSSYINSWGISFFPNMICALIVVITEALFYLFWNSIFWAIFFNIVFGGILIWKIILYVIFLREVAFLKGCKLLGAFIMISIIIAILAVLNANVGLKTPIL